MTAKLLLTGADLDLETLARFQQDRPQVTLADSARQQMQTSVETVQRVIETERVCYGINTGFGALARRSVESFGTHKIDDVAWETFAERLTYVPQGAGPEGLTAAVKEAETLLGPGCRRLHYLSVPPKAAQAVIVTSGGVGGHPALREAAPVRELQHLALARRQFDLGAVSYLALLDAQRQYQQARIALVQARATRYADTAALFQALGGGWGHGAGPHERIENPSRPARKRGLGQRGEIAGRDGRGAAPPISVEAVAAGNKIAEGKCQRAARQRHGGAVGDGCARVRASKSSPRSFTSRRCPSSDTIAPTCVRGRW